MLVKMRKFLTSQKGFTLVELLVVVVVIGVLAAIAIPKFTSATDDAKIAKIKADMRTIASSIALYQARYNGGSPPDLTTLKTANYLSSVPTPPAGATGLTGTDYSYNSSTGVASCSFNAKSYASDGTGL